MYGFKVFVSTLIMMMVVMLTWATVRSGNASGRAVAYMILLVDALSLIAIWG